MQPLLTLSLIAVENCFSFTMHAIQGAMAVRRARERTKRRLSSIRRPGDPTDSTASLAPEAVAQPPVKTESSLTAFHLGVVFILIGFLLVCSSMLSGQKAIAKADTDWGRLLGVGVTLIIVGLFMVMVNRIITEREEEELAKYVKQRLARTRSGNVLVRDAENPEELAAAAAAAARSGQLKTNSGHRRKKSTRSISAGATAKRSVAASGVGQLRQAGSLASVASFQNGKALPVVTITQEDGTKAGTTLKKQGSRRGSRASITPAADGQRSRRHSHCKSAEETERLLAAEDGNKSASHSVSETPATAAGSAPTRKPSKRRKNAESVAATPTASSNAKTS